ncbi:MAG: UvrD-helicase domain-containing protein, partial [Planctomycetota bacterium]
ILKRLAAATLDDRALRELGESLGQSVTVAECHEKLAEVARNLHRVRVSTLDAHFGELARSLAFEIGLPAEWEIADESDVSVLQQWALQEMLGERGASLAAELQHLVGFGDAPRGIRFQLLKNLQEHYDFFREGDFREMEDWLKPQLSLPALNSIERASELEHARHAEMPSHGSIRQAHQRFIKHAEAQDWEGLLQPKFSRAIWTDGDYYNKSFSTETRKALLPLIEHAVHDLLRTRAATTLSMLRLLRQFGRHFDQIKRQTRRYVFNDLPQALLEGAQDLPLEFRMNGGIQHLLLDEFQDTSAGQWRVLAPLAHQIVNDADDGTSYFCVGDVKQAIYGWRGGTSEILKQMNQRLPHCVTECLDLSRRSAPPVIETVNEVFTHLDHHNQLEHYERFVNEWARDFPAHETTKVDEAGYVCLQTSLSSDDEAVWEQTADIVASRLAENPQLEIGILTRENKVILPIIAALRRRGIRASEEGGNSLTDALGVRLILAAMQLADHPGATVHAFLLAQSQLGKSLGLDSSFADRLEVRKTVERTVRRIRGQWEELGLGGMVTSWVQTLVPSLQAAEQARLWQLVDLAYEYESRLGCRFTPFVRFVEERRVSDPTSANIRVMTVHQAKGLEFDCVLLNNLDGGELARGGEVHFGRNQQNYVPNRFLKRISHDLACYLPEDFQQLIDEDTRWRVQDSLCVLYVALTRARHELQILLRPRSSSKKIKHAKSVAGLVHAALAGMRELLPNTILYEVGNPFWCRSADAEASVGVASPREPRGPLKWAPRSAPHSLLPVAPSQLEGGGYVNIGGSFLRQRREAKAFGRLIHGWFELIDWLPASGEVSAKLSLEKAIEYARRLGLNEKQSQKAFERFVEFTASAPAQSVLIEAEYSKSVSAWLGNLPLDPARLSREVRNEQPIAHRDPTQQRVLSGTIDRLIVHREGSTPVAADIIDYKTDPCAEFDETFIREKRDFYSPQLAAYADAVATMFRIPPAHIRKRLLMVAPGHLIEVDEVLIESAS